MARRVIGDGLVMGDAATIQVFFRHVRVPGRRSWLERASLGRVNFAPERYLMRKRAV
jgi:hypothetical protein